MRCSKGVRVNRFVASFLIAGLPSFALFAAGPPAPIQTGSIIGAADESVGVEKYLAGRKASGETWRDVAGVFAAVAYLDRGCTGWLLTPNYLVTNQHCVKSDFLSFSAPEHPLFDDFTQSQCDGLEMRFDYQNRRSELADDEYARPPHDRFKCAKVVLAHQPYDLAIVKLDHPAPPTLRPMRLARAFRPSGQAVYLVGHPAGEPKKVSYRNTTDGVERACVARAARYAPGTSGADDPHPEHAAKDPHSFVHTCDSRGGSSGSPLLSADSLEVVGLHWNGWTNCKWMHFDPHGKIDDTNQRQGDRGSRELEAGNKLADEIPYRPGNTAVDIGEIRDFILGLPTGDAKGQVPEEVKAAFR